MRAAIAFILFAMTLLGAGLLAQGASNSRGMAGDPIDPRARVASDMSDQVPDSIAQPIGPPPDSLD